MGVLRKIELSDADDGQIVRIPGEFRLPGREATIRKDGETLILAPTALYGQGPNAALVALLSTLEPIDEVIGTIEDFPPEPFEF